MHKLLREPTHDKAIWLFVIIGLALCGLSLMLNAALQAPCFLLGISFCTLVGAETRAQRATAVALRLLSLGPGTVAMVFLVIFAVNLVSSLR